MGRPFDRGARKDFLDLYELALQGVTLSSLPPPPQKIPRTAPQPSAMIKGLSYFDDAEHDPWPVMLRDVSWSALQRYFLSSQTRLLRSLPDGNSTPQHGRPAPFLQPRDSSGGRTASRPTCRKRESKK